MKKQLKSGFTLAEVLITLSIIGIIAAIVMPSVISSYQYKTVGVKLSKFLASTEQASRAYVVSNDSFKSTDNNGIMDFINDSFIFTDITGSSLTTDQKSYLGVEDLSDAQKANTYAYSSKTTPKELNSFVTTLNVEPTGSGTDEPAVGVLKDGTSITVLPAKAADYTYHKAAVDQAKIGYPAMNITFMPKVTGLPSSAQRKYNFVVTELGYVVPNDADSCLWKIYQDDWRTNSKTFIKGGYCNNDGKVVTWKTTNNGDESGKKD